MIDRSNLSEEATFNYPFFDVVDEEGTTCLFLSKDISIRLSKFNGDILENHEHRALDKFIEKIKMND